MEASLGPYHLEIATDFGPRITSLRLGEGPELLARLGPGSVLRHDAGIYTFRGGHRLWASPELASITYASDDHPCEVSATADMLTVSAPADAAGLVKEVSVSPDGASLVLEHRITSAETRVGPLAPWAITQFPLGGTALLPFAGDDSASSANRYLVLWPYTSVEDRRVRFGDEVLELEASSGPELKFGVGPAPGRLGYFREGLLFIKDIESATDRLVPDFGAAGQVYVGHEFCELESVGALADLSNGGQAVLRERWTVVDCGDVDEAIELTVDP